MKCDSGSSSGAPLLTLAELVGFAKQFRYKAADDRLFLDPAILDDLLEDLLDMESRFDEVEIAVAGTPFTAEKKLALAEALSLSTAISAFELEIIRLGRVSTEQTSKALDHAAKSLRNALGRFIVFADGIE
jgi:hypothetical protein